MSKPGEMTEAHREAERYAGKLEHALEGISVVARLARLASYGTAPMSEQCPFQPQDLVEALAAIETLARVKDDRKCL